MDYYIACTSAVDLNQEIIDKNNIKCVYYSVNKDGKEFLDDFFNSYPYEQFYDDIKSGLQYKTSQFGYGRYLEFLGNLLKEGKNVLFIGLSGGITGDTATVTMAAKEINEQYENKVYVLDSLCASSGYGMLVVKACENRDKGMSFEDNIKWLEDYKLSIHHWFVSSDLSSYVRGGRLSKAAGLVGTALKICPLMYMPGDGTLEPFEKIRTESKALRAQVEKMKELCKDGLDYDDYVWISCSNCDEQAMKVAEMIKEEFHNVKEVKIFHVGAAIGSHTGPGTTSLYFIGKKRA